MFQYTNSIILNSNLDSSGKAKWSSDSSEGTLYIKRFMKFNKDNVLAIYKRAYEEAELSKVTFTMSAQGVGVYRVLLYMRLTDNNNSYYANDMVYKGKPLVYEFAITTTTDNTSAKMAKYAKEAIESINTYFGNNYITASYSGSVLTITGTDEHQVFVVAKIQRFNPAADTALIGGVFEDIIEATVDGTTSIIENGNPGFGTYLLLIKDFRLPTAEALRFGGVNQEELPILGANYNQYTINYCINRGILGSDAIGDAVKSATTHVLYVNTNIAEAFETALSAIGTINEITAPDSDSDTSTDTTDDTTTTDDDDSTSDAD